MSSGLFSRDGELSNLKRALRSRVSNVLIVYGDSGVGKSTLLNAALEQIGASEKVLRYSFVNDGLPFKTYLNEVLFSVFAKSSLLAKLFRKRFRLTSAHIEPVKRLSVTFYNKAYDAPLNEKKSRPRGFVFESSHYRLNGTPNQEFFGRLWRHLKNSGVFYINLTNIERADPESKELILLLVQTAPKDIRFVLEYGIFGGNVGRYNDFETSARTIDPKLVAVRVDPFDEATAERFYKALRAVNPHLPSFDYASNRGNPLAIIYDLREIDARYRPSRVITALMRRTATQNTLLLLAVLDGVVTALDELSSLAKVASIKFSLRELISTGVVRANEGIVDFSHPYFASYIKVGYAAEIRELALKISERAKKTNPLIASYLLLRYAMRRGDTGHEAELTFLVQVICEAMDRRDMHILAVLLPPMVEFSEMLNETQKVILHLIDLQFRVYNFRIEDADFKHTGTRADSLCYLLMLQHLYHSNRFSEAIAMVDSENTRNQLRQLSKFPALFGHFSEVTLAIKATCEISLGHWEDAVQLLRQVNRQNCLGRVGNYLEIFDGFVGGYELEANKSKAPSASADTYTAAKVLHNIIASGICAHPGDVSHSKNIVSTLIPLFVESRSREVTYCLNNLAASYLLQAKALEAIEVLDEMRTRTFEVYDDICCELNSAIASVMLERTEEGMRHVSAARDLIARKKFSDPYFIGLTDYTLALTHLSVGAGISIEASLENVQFPDAIAKREPQLMGKLARARKLCEKEPSLNEIIPLFEPALLHFWDFNTPLVDQSALDAFVWSS
jgi:adenylate kinase